MRPVSGRDLVWLRRWKKSWWKFTPKVSISYDIHRRDMMVYALYSRGYRGGGFNGRPATIGAATIPYDPETLDNYRGRLQNRIAERARALQRLSLPDEI